MNIDWQLFLSAVALAFIFEAIPYVIAPEKVKNLLAEIGHIDPVVLRRFGFKMLVLGLFALYIIRRTSWLMAD